MTVGKYTYGHDNIAVFWEGNPPYAAKLIIGSFCSIGGRIKIYCGGTKTAILAVSIFQSHTTTQTKIKRSSFTLTGFSKQKIVSGSSILKKELQQKSLTQNIKLKHSKNGSVVKKDSMAVSLYKTVQMVGNYRVIKSINIHHRLMVGTTSKIFCKKSKLKLTMKT